MIPDVAGAPPTLAPQATPGGGAQAPQQPAQSGAAEQQPAQGGAAQQQPAQGQQAGGQAAIGGGGEPIQLEALDPADWSVYEFDAAPGQIINAINVGVLPHTFAVDEWDMIVDLPNGEPVEIAVPDDAEVGASLVYYCSVPGHLELGMAGTLTVVEAGGAPAAAAAEQAPAEQAPAAQGGQAASGGATEPIHIEALDPADWSVYEFNVAPGQVIEAVNVGVLPHTFAVDEWGLDENLPNGEPVNITVPEDAEVGAALVYYCSVPGHLELGMAGTLTVVEAGGAPAAGGQAPAGQQAPASPEATPAAPATPQPAATPAAPAASPVPPPAMATPAPGTIALYAEDPSTWNPNTLTVSAGDTLSVVNTGVLQHDFTVDEWNISQFLPNGGLVEIQIPDTVQSGQTFTFYSSEHREEGMEGTLKIR